MRRGQKKILIASTILILALTLALGCFLWMESKKDGEEAAKGNMGGASEGISEENQEEQQSALEEGAQDGQGDSREELGLQQETDGPQDEPAMQQETDGPQDELVMQQEQQREPVTLFFTGDIMLGGSVRANYDAKGITGVLSDYLLSEMQQADVTVINQEFAFSTRGTPMSGKQYTFRVDPSYVSAFLDMGVDVASLANNHALDFGTEALLDTFDVLDEAGIPYGGAGETKERAAQPVYLKCGDRTIGVLAASRVIPVVSWNIDNQQPGMFCTYDSTQLVAAIQETKKNCDYVVVFVHWGVERKDLPEEYQRQLGREYIDAGADLVVGSHPHVPQGIEYYNGKPVVYSLGNFIFNKTAANTYALKVVLTPEDEARLQVIPVGVSEAKTSELAGQERQDLLDRIQSISRGVSVDEEGMVFQTEE